MLNNLLAIRMYGTKWCPDCTRAIRFLDQQQVEYIWIDIDQDKQAREKVININQGKRIVPTIVFPDGDILVEPSNSELKEKLSSLSQ